LTDQRLFKRCPRKHQAGSDESGTKDGCVWRFAVEKLSMPVARVVHQEIARLVADRGTRIVIPPVAV
jgi:hypothetical protein